MRLALLLSDFCAAQLFKQIGFTNYKNGILSFWLPIFILTVGAAIAIIVSGFLFALYHLGYPGFRAVGDILLLFAVRIGFAVSFKLAENNLFVSYFVNLPNAFITYILKFEQFPKMTIWSTVFAGITIIFIDVIFFAMKVKSGRFDKASSIK